MIKIASDTYVIDTPGVREIDPFGIRKEDLGHYFIEFKPFADNCRFNTCTHCHEPGCKVVKAVENNEISETRYESYLRILDTIEEDIIY
jgi:ribosome biogenesis GTPase